MLSCPPCVCFNHVRSAVYCVLLFSVLLSLNSISLETNRDCCVLAALCMCVCVCVCVCMCLCLCLCLSFEPSITALWLRMLRWQGHMCTYIHTNRHTCVSVCVCVCSFEYMCVVVSKMRSRQQILMSIDWSNLINSYFLPSLFVRLLSIGEQTKSESERAVINKRGRKVEWTEVDVRYR